MFYILRQRGRIGYDEYSAKVVRADNPKEARALANENVGDEGQIWSDSKMVSCNSIKAEGKSKIILGSFNAG